MFKQLFSSGLDTSLQVLDAKSLLKQQTYISSTPGSSLDLEWEHEGNILLFDISESYNTKRNLFRAAHTNDER